MIASVELYIYSYRFWCSWPAFRVIVGQQHHQPTTFSCFKCNFDVRTEHLVFCLCFFLGWGGGGGGGQCLQ